MKPSFIQTRGTEFVLDGQPIRLRGYTLGTWMIPMPRISM